MKTVNLVPSACSQIVFLALNMEVGCGSSREGYSLWYTTKKTWGVTVEIIGGGSSVDIYLSFVKFERLARTQH